MSRYKIVRELGRNREAGRITYLATDTRLNPPQQVVIKEFRFALADAKWSGFKAYQREIEVLRELDYFRGRQAPPKPDAKGLLPGKLPRQIPSLLTMKQAGAARLVTSRILCMVKKN
jgi:hypothetical protein